MGAFKREFGGSAFMRQLAQSYNKQKLRGVKAHFKASGVLFCAAYFPFKKQFCFEVAKKPYFKRFDNFFTVLNRPK